MHLVHTKVRSGNSFKVYTRLVESFRRPDGMPAQRVLANLGELTDQQYENLRLALKASRQSKSVVLSEEQASSWNARIVSNLAYLDVAVALEMWRSWKLSELVDKLIDERSVAVKAADVVCALTIQRCVAPASKLAAQRWFPRTALPELLDVEPASFHNTRIHRVLEKLDQVESELQQGLVRRYHRHDGSFATLFTDVTDTWFEGRGPDLAQRSRTKEGLRNRHKVGILLLCNEKGYPVRWKTLPGRKQDGPALRDLVGEIEGEKWAHSVPIVFDRAMGTAGAVARLYASGLQFVTAARRTEIASYVDKIPNEGLGEITGSEDEAVHKGIIAEAGKRAEAAGMEKVGEHLYVFDFGVRSRKLRVAPDELDDDKDIDGQELEVGAYWLWKARQYRKQLDEKVFGTQAEIAKAHGVSRARISQIMMLLRLDERLQKKVLAGAYGRIEEKTLRAIAALRTKAAQRRALEEHGRTGTKTTTDKARRWVTRPTELDASLRLVLYFNPQMLADQRLVAHRHRAAIDAFVADLNLRLKRGDSRKSAQSVYAEVKRKLWSMSMVSVYRIDIDEVETEGRKHFVVRLAFDEEKWNERRSADGFVLLVGHPQLPHSAAEVVALYHAKDAVEKDFQSIKSDLDLRPVFHYTDPKVRAHVTLCMLALLLERTMEQKLAKAQRPKTAAACFEELASCHLNMVETGPAAPHSYIATEPKPPQRGILKALKLTRITNQETLIDRLHPRSET